jgi:hypothetical protein
MFNEPLCSSGPILALLPKKDDRREKFRTDGDKQVGELCVLPPVGEVERAFAQIWFVSQQMGKAMRRNNLGEWPSVLVLLAVMTCAVPADGAEDIPARAGIDYRRLRQNATELVFILVDRVTVTDNGEDVVEYQIDATVEVVERSERKLTKGQRISFESYCVKPDARQRGFVGPESPKELYRGWTGWVFLDKSPRGAGLHPAAYGRSFDHYRDRAMPKEAQPAGVPAIEQLMAKLTEVQIKTTRELIGKGYYSEAEREVEITAAEAVERAVPLKKMDFQGWQRLYDKALDRAIKRSQEVQRLPKK